MTEKKSPQLLPIAIVIILAIAATGYILTFLASSLYTSDDSQSAAPTTDDSAVTIATSKANTYSSIKMHPHVNGVNANDGSAHYIVARTSPTNTDDTLPIIANGTASNTHPQNVGDPMDANDLNAPGRKITASEIPINVGNAMNAEHFDTMENIPGEVPTKVSVPMDAADLNNQNPNSTSSIPISVGQPISADIPPN